MSLALRVKLLRENEERGRGRDEIKDGARYSG